MRQDVHTFTRYPLISRVILITNGGHTFLRRRTTTYPGPIRMIPNKTAHTRDTGGNILTTRNSLITIRSTTHPFIDRTIVRTTICTTTTYKTTTPTIPMGSAIGQTIHNSNGAIPRTYVITRAPSHDALCTIRAPRYFSHTTCLTTLRRLSTRGTHLIASSYDLFRLAKHPIRLARNSCTGLGVAAQRSLPHPRRGGKGPVHVNRNCSIRHLIRNHGLVLNNIRVPCRGNLLNRSSTSILTRTIVSTILNTTTLNSVKGRFPSASPRCTKTSDLVLTHRITHVIQRGN